MRKSSISVADDLSCKGVEGSSGVFFLLKFRDAAPCGCQGILRVLFNHVDLSPNWLVVGHTCMRAIRAKRRVVVGEMRFVFFFRLLGIGAAQKCDVLKISYCFTSIRMPLRCVMGKCKIYIYICYYLQTNVFIRLRRFHVCMFFRR